MPREAYPAARAVSTRLHAYFAGQAAEQNELDRMPSAETIELIIEAAFWASLRREEGYSPRISMAFLAPGQSVESFIFERPLAVEPGVLTRISPAVERAGIHLGVWRDPTDGLRVWGAARGLPRICFVVEVSAPGLIVIKNHSGETSTKFVNVAVLEGDQVKVVSQRVSDSDEIPSSVNSVLGYDSPLSWVRSVNVLAQLAVSMRSQGRGGSLLVVPSDTDRWRGSIVPPIPYALSPSFAGLARSSREPETLRRTIDAIAGLTAVDGAVVLTDTYEVLGFGAKIMRRKGHPQVEQVLITEPIEGGIATLAHPEQLGGTRHLSAAQFVQDQTDAVALVASQDQRFTVFEWSPRDKVVQAHRVDTLLL
jgi:sensor domain DACNV-containing protein